MQQGEFLLSPAMSPPPEGERRAQAAADPASAARWIQPETAESGPGGRKGLAALPPLRDSPQDLRSRGGGDGGQGLGIEGVPSPGLPGRERHGWERGRAAPVRGTRLLPSRDHHADHFRKTAARGPPPKQNWRKQRPLRPAPGSLPSAIALGRASLPGGKGPLAFCPCTGCSPLTNGGELMGRARVHRLAVIPPWDLSTCARKKTWRNGAIVMMETW